MRFIVDLFRYIIFAFCGLMIIAAVLIALNLGSVETGSWPAGLVIAAIFVVFGLVVLNLGGIAILVSMHDRHAELVEEAVELNGVLSEIARALASRDGAAS